MTDLSSKMGSAFDFVKNRLFSSRTFLIYDHVIDGRERELPTPEEIKAGFPNPCGYSTGMEDGMINGATMLDACLIKYGLEGDETAAELARDLAEGMLRCAESAEGEGFLPRAVAVEDGKSHYPDSSRDQYTMFAFAMHRCLNSSLCTPDLRRRITLAAEAIARRAERNVTEQYSFDMLTEDGRPTLVNVMWGDTLSNHEYMRLPMLYLLAFEAGGDPHWRDKYLELREVAYKKSLPMGRYWALYTLQQMQVSVRLCYDVETDTRWRERYLHLMNEVADYVEEILPRIRARMEAHYLYNLPQASFRDLELIPAERFARLGYVGALTPVRKDSAEFFILQDCAQAAIITKTVPDRATDPSVERLLIDAFARIDLSVHERNLPLYFTDGYYRCRI